MKGYKCDRCNEFVPQKDVGEHTYYEISFVYEWEERDTSGKGSQRYQLCNECRSELVNWVEVVE